MFLATERKEASEIGAESGRILRQENCILKKEIEI